MKPQIIIKNFLFSQIHFRKKLTNQLYNYNRLVFEYFSILNQALKIIDEYAKTDEKIKFFLTNKPITMDLAKLDFAF